MLVWGKGLEEWENIAEVPFAEKTIRSNWERSRKKGVKPLVSLKAGKHQISVGTSVDEFVSHSICKR